MKKQTYNLLLACFLIIGSFLNAQVGIGTEDPKATLDIKAISGSTVDGLLLPSVDKDRAQNMAANAQNGTLVYINSATGTGGNSTVGVSAPGIYSMNEGKWGKLNADRGAVYVNMEGSNPNFRSWDRSTMPTIEKYDYIILFTNSNINGKLTLPLASENKGRILYYVNGTTGGLQFVSGNPSNNITPFNYKVLSVSSSCGFISDGVQWYPLGR